MNLSRSLTALAIAAVIGAGPFLPNAFAADAKPATSGTSAADTAADAAKAVPQTASKDSKATQQDDKLFIQTVAEAHMAVKEIHDARLAIFNGSTEEAEKLVKDAEIKLEAAQRYAAIHGMQSQTSGDADEVMLPFDSGFSLAEGFVPEPEHQAAMGEAQQKITRGDQKGAAQTLKLAGIDISVSAALLPANSSLERVTSAAKLIDEKKYHEANLALKAVEDSIVVESWSASAVPAQGAAGAVKPANG